MFNVTIIDIKKSLLKIVIITTILIVTFLITQITTKLKANEIFQVDISEKLINCLNNEIPAIETTNYQSENLIRATSEKQEKNISKMILNLELSEISTEEATENEENNAKPEKTEEKENEANDEVKQDADEKSQNITQVVTDGSINTEIVTKNPIAESYNLECNGVKIKNETSFEINNDIENVDLNIDKKNILIFHTHTCESYTPTEQNNYQQTGNFRTTDLNFSVARVGDELTNYLSGYGFNIVHDKTYHDYPAYTGSYTRSMSTVESILQTNSSDIIIDLHRDAIGSKSEYDPSVRIGEDVVAQLMFVIGTNGGGLYHPNWQSNLKFAIDIQQKANEMYPGLFKPIIVRNSRYNQHLGKAACIIEVGSTGNTLEQSIASMKYLSAVLEEYSK